MFRIRSLTFASFRAIVWERLGERMGKLNAISIRKLPAGRHGDGEGLYLLVKPTGARSWLLRVQNDGKRRDVGLGSIAKLSLAEARDEATRLRKHALNGRDPITERDRTTFEPKTFREAVPIVHDAKKAGWSKKTSDSFLATLAEHAYPALGDLRVEDIHADDVASALKPIWTSKPAIAVKVRQRINTVLAYAKAKKWRTTEAPGQSLGQLLSAQPEGGAMAAMPFADVPAFVASIEGKEQTVGRLALLFLIATAARGGEVRQARWDQIDFGARLWNRPATMMKGRKAKAHSVTLNDAAIAVLHRAAGNGAKEGLIFAGAKGKPLSDMTLSKILRDEHLPYVPHGFRSSFRDWAAEEMPEIPDPVAEAALAHVVPDKVVAAYKRTTFIEMRRRLLAEWGAFAFGATDAN